MLVRSDETRAAARPPWSWSCSRWRLATAPRRQGSDEVGDSSTGSGPAASRSHPRTLRPRLPRAVTRPSRWPGGRGRVAHRGRPPGVGDRGRRCGRAPHRSGQDPSVTAVDPADGIELWSHPATPSQSIRGVGIRLQSVDGSVAHAEDGAGSPAIVVRRDPWTGEPVLTPARRSATGRSRPLRLRARVCVHERPGRRRLGHAGAR